MKSNSPFYKKQEPFPEIKKANRGKFTKWAKSHGFKDACSAASAVMAKKEGEKIKGTTITTNIREMANYANNFGCKNK